MVRLEYIAAGALLAYMLVAVTLLYWAIMRAPALADRTDNPRLVEAELRIRRGRVLDANGVVLAETIGPQEDPLRYYPVPAIGPAVGYYSFRHGTAGIEQGYDDVLRGENGTTWASLWNGALHRSQVGQDIRLTLDADLQREAEAAMGDLSGALIVLSVPDGAVKAMVSHPGYDPNRLDELFDDLVADASAPLLNRATQGQYQPGLTLQPFVLASALDQGIISLRDHVEGGDDPVVVHDQLRGCSDVLQEPATWSAVLKAACPAPMVDLAAELGEEGLLLSFERFGFFAQPEFPVATIAVESQPIADIQSAIVGQGSLTVTPLQVARGWAALANGGALPDPYLVTEIQNSAGVWQAEKLPEPNLLAVSQGSADAIVAALRDEETGIVEHSTAALSGPQAATNEWYLGLTPAQTPQFAVVLVIENPSSASAAERVGRSVLELAQEAD